MLLIRSENPRRCQAENPLKLLSEFARPALPTLDPGAGKTRTAWLWVHARDDRPFGGAEPPMVAYRFEDTRSGDCAARHLGDYRGILQCGG